jgi:hypothetical protein
MELMCTSCGKKFYISEQDPIPDIENLSCDMCNGILKYVDDDDFEYDEDPSISMIS